MSLKKRKSKHSETREVTAHRGKTTEDTGSMRSFVSQREKVPEETNTVNMLDVQTSEI